MLHHCLLMPKDPDNHYPPQDDSELDCLFLPMIDLSVLLLLLQAFCSALSLDPCQSPIWLLQRTNLIPTLVQWIPRDKFNRIIILFIVHPVLIQICTELASKIAFASRATMARFNRLLCILLELTYPFTQFFIKSYCLLNIHPISVPFNNNL